jgi:hypothetical protein
MVIEPGIEVNPVVDAASADPNVRHVELSQQRDPDAQVDRRLFLGQTAHGRQWQVGLLVHGIPCLPR